MFYQLQFFVLALKLGELGAQLAVFLLQSGEFLLLFIERSILLMTLPYHFLNLFLLLDLLFTIDLRLLNELAHRLLQRINF